MTAPTRPAARLTSTAWTHRALTARDLEHTALVDAELLDISDDPTDTGLGQYRRALHQTKLDEAAAHRVYAMHCETAAASAAAHELDTYTNTPVAAAAVARQHAEDHGDDHGPACRCSSCVEDLR